MNDEIWFDRHARVGTERQSVASVEQNIGAVFVVARRHTTVAIE